MTAMAGFNAASCAVPAKDPTHDVSIMLNNGTHNHTPTAGTLNVRTSPTDGTLESSCCDDDDVRCCCFWDSSLLLLLIRFIFSLLLVLPLYQPAVSAVEDDK
jgi:hypothetical protein